jgi:lipopolysaccharide exporter
MINVKGELFTTSVSYGAMAVIRLGSSMVLTRLLYPEAFGIVTMISSVIFVIEMLSDVGIVGLLIRHEKGDQPTYLNTMWTVRLMRSCGNAVLLFFAAPWVAEWYDTPALTDALRLFSLWFILFGLESTSFILAVRNKNTRIVNFTELFCLLVSTLFSIAYSYHSRDYHGILYGILLNRFLNTVISHRFYPQLKHRLMLDKTATRDLFHFAKFVMPSSMITLAVNQYDKVIFLKLFELKLLGLYSLASNMSAPLDGLVTKISRTLLYPRCAEYFRHDPSTLVQRYYTENLKLHAVVLLLPALLFGMATLVVDVLYDSRYAFSGVILQAFAVRSMILPFASTAEDLLVASGRTRIQLIGNIIRLCYLVPAVFIGYHFFGFRGFIYFAMLEMLPTVLFYTWVQRQEGLINFRYEGLRLGFVIATALLSYGACEMFRRLFL